MMAMSIQVSMGQKCKLVPIPSKYSKLSATTIPDVMGWEKSQQFKAKSQKAGAADVDFVKAFVKLKEADQSTAAAIRDMGIEVTFEGSRVLIANIPYSKLQDVAALENVEQIDKGGTLHAMNNTARQLTQTDEVNAGTSETGYKAYTGKGVLVGVVDEGIDFNHINFKDADGNSRIKRARIYDADKKTTSVYTDAAEIAQLTTDDSTNTHGTHVMGTAAGSYAANGFQGMASESDLFPCAGFNPATTTIEHCADIFKYADGHHQPAVINMSFGNISDPHDTSNVYSEALKDMVADGHVVCFSAGNYGNSDYCLKKAFNDTDTIVRTTIQAEGIAGDINLYWGNNSGTTIYELTDRNISVSLLVLHVQEGKEKEIVRHFDFDIKASEDSVMYKIDDELATYFPVEMSTISADYENKPRIYLQVSRTSSGKRKIYISTCMAEVIDTLSQNYYDIGLSLSSKDNAVFEAFNNLSFWGSDDGMYTAGQGENAINTLACNPYCISVGSYNSSNDLTDIYGNVAISMDECENWVGKLYNISNFSSYGTDWDGRTMPTITAPGCFLTSSISRYDAENYLNQYFKSAGASLKSSVEKDGETYQWATMVGTSMACPVVTGIIATWLQCKPDLSIEEIKTIMKNSADRDSFVVNGNSLRWGYGKINAYEGLKYILTTAIDDPKVNFADELLVKSLGGGNIEVVFPGETGTMTVCLYDMSGKLVQQQQLSTDNGRLRIDVSRQHEGLYYMQVCSNGKTAGAKVPVRF